MAGYVCVNRMVVGGGRGGIDPDRRGGGRRLDGETLTRHSVYEAAGATTA